MKDELRKELIRMRNNLPKSEVLEKSNLVKKRLFETDEFKQAYAVLFYVSYNNEVHTHDMIKESMSNGKRVIVPVTDKENKKLILSELKNWNDLTYGTYNILEPRRECIIEVSPNSIDLIILPGVGFDKYGHRIGYGGGYYDRLLENATYLWSIGLAFELQIVGNVPTGKYDISVNEIITEERTIACSDYF